MPHPTTRILVADPDAATLAVFDEFLRREGYATITCQTTRTAYQLIELERPSLLLVNVDLDWYGAGLDLLALLRQEQATAALPVIVCTAAVSKLRTHGWQLAAWNCFSLELPFSERSLLTTVQAALDSTLRSRAVGG